MIKGANFIVFSDDWGRHPSSCQHIFKRFLPYNRVLWVNTIGMRPPTWSVYDLVRVSEKLVEWCAPQRNDVSLPDNLSVLSPPAIPYNKVGMIRWFNRRIGVSKVREAMKRRRLTHPIVVTTLPNAVDFLGHLDEAASIYYCVDEFREYPDWPSNMVAEMEDALLRKANLVIASSGELQRRKSNGSRETKLVPHGVDVEHFASVRGVDVAPPPAMSGIPHPIIGFFGVIGEWVDLQMVAAMARMKKQWSWVFIGPVQANTEVLRNCPNVFLLGKVDYNDLPQFSKHFDVAIIPFLVNDLTLNVNPLKLLEFLACGLPVVSTAMPEVSRYGNVVSIAGTPELFIAAIENALAHDTEAHIQERVKIASDASWEARAEEFSKHIEQLQQGTC